MKYKYQLIIMNFFKEKKIKDHILLVQIEMKVQIRLDHIQIVRIATDFFSIFFTFTKRSTFCFFNTFFGDFLLVLEAIDLILLRLIVLSNRVVLFIKTSLWKLLYIFISISIRKFNQSWFTWLQDFVDFLESRMKRVILFP